MKLTQNDPMKVVALTHRFVYSQADVEICPSLQISDICRSRGDFSDEPTSVRQYGIRPAYGQTRAPRRLWVSGRIDPLGMAKALGRADISNTRDFWHRHRTGSTFHGRGPDRLSRRYTRKYVGRGARSHYFPYFLDTTPTLNRRYSCAA